MPTFRIGTFNLENLDDRPGEEPSLDKRIAVLRPQLMRVNADILCLQEVNGQERPGQPRSLSALESLIQTTQYENYNVISTLTRRRQVYDERNLVVLVRSDLQITEAQSIKHRYAPKPRYRTVTATRSERRARYISWERPLLYARIDLGGNRIVHLINVHMKSKLPTDIPGQTIEWYRWRSVAGWAEGYFVSSMKRVGQALEARILIDRIFDEQGEDALIAICGDFNADIDSVPVNAIRGPVEETGNPDLIGRIMAPCELTVPESSRYSLLHLGKGKMLDHILVSRSMLAYYRGAEIHNEILPDESGAFRTDVKFPESDHAPVVAEFLLP